MGKLDGYGCEWIDRWVGRLIRMGSWLGKGIDR